MLFCDQLLASTASNRCKHDMGALSWLNVEAVEIAPTPPVWQTCKVFRPWALFPQHYGIYIYSNVSREIPFGVVSIGEGGVASKRRLVGK